MPCSNATSHPEHTHGLGCGHEAVPHGDHIDYIVNGRLHHVHMGIVTTMDLLRS